MTENQKENNHSISVVVPAYNEEENLTSLFENFDKMFKESGLKGEVILIDDGSDDGTYKKAIDYEKQYSFLKVLSNERHQGVTAALQTGFKEAKGDVFFFWPADMQYYPTDIPKLLKKMTDEKKDMITGWRQDGFKIWHIWKLKKLVYKLISWFYNTLSRLFFKVTVHDSNGVKAFKKKVYKYMPSRRDWHRYMVIIAADMGFKIDEVKIPVYDRKYGATKFSLWKAFIGGLDFISVVFQIKFMRKPMLLFGSIGLVLMTSGFIAGLYAIYLRVIEHEGFRPLLYLVILLVLAGISFFAIGFLAEAIASSKEEIENLRKDLK